MIQIVVYDASNWKVIKSLWTDEKPQDVINAIESGVACYESKNALQEANEGEQA